MKKQKPIVRAVFRDNRESKAQQTIQNQQDIITVMACLIGVMALAMLHRTFFS